MSFPLNPVNNQVYKNYYFNSSVNAWLRNNFDPIGTITEYDGTNWIDGVTKPGWFACIPENSDKDCPDMTDRFSIGSKNTTLSKTYGGTNTVTLTAAQIPSHCHGMAHDHTASSANSTHSHTLDNVALSHGGQSHTHVYFRAISAAGRQGGTINTATGSYINRCSSAVTASFCNHPAHTHTVTSNTGSHNHPITVNDTDKVLTDFTGGSEPHENRPAFYSMIFIRKCEQESEEFPLNPVDNQVYKNYYFSSSANAWLRNDFDPIGTITEYDSSNWIDGVTKPGWFACIPENSDKDCPDMTDRFVMGKNVVSAKTCGGANIITLTTAQIPSHCHGMAHSHTASSANSTHSHNTSTSTAPSAHSVSAHCHSYSGHNSSANICGGGSRRAANENTASNVSGVGLSNHSNHNHTISGGSHNHTITVDDTDKVLTDFTGGGESHENRPPFYSMIYIRKCF